MRAVWPLVVTALACLAHAQPAAADTTICDLGAALKFDYGTKVRAVVRVPRQAVETFRADMDEFFSASGYSVWAVGARDSLVQLPQSPNVHFQIETRSDREFAYVALSTFSFDCTTTEDWRPHWARFVGQLRGSDYRAFIAWRPVIPVVSQTVGGGWDTPVPLLLLGLAIDHFSKPLPQR